jgi:hypothetical protein
MPLAIGYNRQRMNKRMKLLLTYHDFPKFDSNTSISINPVM